MVLNLGTVEKVFIAEYVRQNGRVYLSYNEVIVWGGGSGEKVRETTRRTDRTKRKSRILGTQKCSITIVNILLIYITRVNNSTNTKTCYDIVFHIQYGSMLLLHVSKKKTTTKIKVRE